MKTWDRALSGIAALGGAWWCGSAVYTLASEGMFTLSGFSGFMVVALIALRTIDWMSEALFGERF